MAPNRLILDTDGGVDDAQALLLLIAAGRAPDAITTVFGNVSLDSATRNVLATLAQMRKTRLVQVFEEHCVSWFKGLKRA